MPDTSLLFGPFLLGVCLNILLYGILIVQTFIYFRTYSRDSKRIQYLVLYLFIMETINCVCDIGIIYQPLVLQYGDLKSLTTAPLMLTTDAITTVLISTPAQLFIAWRMRVVSRSNLFPILVAVFSIVSFVGGIRLSVLVGFSAEFSRFSRFEFSTLLWLGAGVAADLFITIGLTVSLKTRKKSINKETDDKVAGIIKLTIQTGALTMIFATIDLVLFLTSHTSLNFIPDLALSKLFTNSLLCTLNARGGWEKPTGRYQENALFDRSEMSDVRKQHVGTLPSIQHDVVQEEAPTHESNFNINENPADSMALQAQEPAHYGGLGMQRPTPLFQTAPSYTSTPRGSSDNLTQFKRDDSVEDIRWKRVGTREYF